MSDPTGVSIKTDFHELMQLHALMAEMGRKSSRMDKALRAISQAMLKSTLQRFDDQASPDGVPWEPSAAAKARTSHKKGHTRKTGKTLMDTLHFRNTTFSAETSNTEAIWGTNAIQAAIFQFGGKIKFKTHTMDVIARPFMGVNEDDARTVEDILSAAFGLEAA